MRKRFAAVVATAGACVLVAGSPVSAGSTATGSAGKGLSTASAAASRPNVANAAVGFRVYNARCTATQIRFTADTFETGRSGVQRFRQKAQLQEFVGGRWVARSRVVTVTSQRFPDDRRSFHFVRNWVGTHPANGNRWREAWRGLYLNGAGQVIARTRVIFVTCR